MHTLIFADGALKAKNARDCSQKQYFEESMEWKNGGRNGQKNEKSKSNHKKCSYRGLLGVNKVHFLIKMIWSRFAKMCPPLEQEQHFWKNVMQKVSWNMKNIKLAVWSLHFWCMFVSMSMGNAFFASCSALAIVFAKSQNQPDGRFWVAGRNAQGRWEDFWGVCDLQIEIGILIFALWIRHAVPCLRQGRRIAPRIPPRLAIGNANCGMGDNKLDIRYEKMHGKNKNIKNLLKI